MTKTQDNEISSKQCNKLEPWKRIMGRFANIKCYCSGHSLRWPFSKYIVNPYIGNPVATQTWFSVKIILVLMLCIVSNQAAYASDITATVQGTILSFSNSGFDATRVQNPAVVDTGSGYTMLYAGLPFSNNYQIGLATSSDGVAWTKSSVNPVISNTNSPAWASFREVPATLMYTGGLYQLWFNGNNTNLVTDPGNFEGFGYATSTDGTNWSIDPNPIRGGANSGSSFYSLSSVAKINSQYYAYFLTPAGALNVATSSDGMNFTGDRLVNAPTGYSLYTTTSTAGGLFSVWQSGGQYYYGTSKNGIDFTIDGQINGLTNFGVNSVLVNKNQLTIYGSEGVGNVNWGYGNSVISYATATIPPVPEPATPTLFGIGLAVVGYLRKKQIAILHVIRQP